MRIVAIQPILAILTASLQVGALCALPRHQTMLQYEHTLWGAGYLHHGKNAQFDQPTPKVLYQQPTVKLNKKLDKYLSPCQIIEHLL